jgi:hypothetical protein
MPAMRSHPLRPNIDPAQGRFAMNPTRAAAIAIDNMMSADRADPPPSNVVSASTTPSAITISANDGTNASVTAVSAAN